MCIEYLKESIVIKGDILKVSQCINCVRSMGLQNLEHFYIIPKVIGKWEIQ